MTTIDRCEAVYSGAIAAWKRVLLFVAAGLAGHCIGLISAYTVVGSPFRIDLDLDFGAVALFPIGYFCQFFQHATYLPLSLIYFTLLAISFWIIIYTETSPCLSVPPLIVLQTWDTFFIQRKIGLQQFLMEDRVFSVWGGVFAVVGTLAMTLILVTALKQWYSPQK